MPDIPTGQVALAIVTVTRKPLLTGIAYQASVVTRTQTHDQLELERPSQSRLAAGSQSRHDSHVDLGSRFRVESCIPLINLRESNAMYGTEITVAQWPLLFCRGLTKAF